MQKIKKSLSLLLALTLLFSLCGAVAYAEDGVENEIYSGLQSEVPEATPTDAAPAVKNIVLPVEPLPPDLTGGVVTWFVNERFYSIYESKTFSFSKDDLSELYELLEDIGDALYCSVKLPGDSEDVSTAEAVCIAEWNTADSPLDQAGRYAVIATLLPPDGCTFGIGVRTQIVLQVQILDESAPVQITKIDDWNPYSLAVAVPQDGTEEDITQNSLFQDYSSGYLSCEDENGGQHFADISWNFSPIDWSVPGTYPISGTPVAPEGTVFADNLTLPTPTAAISVQAAGKPDINCFYLLYPYMRLPWIAPSGDLAAATVWLSEDEGDWRELTSVDEVHVNETEVEIDLDLFVTEKNYQVQVDYEGGQTGILSFSWDDAIVIEGYWEGDRDGSDGNDNTPPGLGQPPPGNGNDGSGGSGGGDYNSSGSGGGGSLPSTPPPTPTPAPTPDPEPTFTPTPTLESTPKPPPAEDDNQSGSSAPVQNGGQQPPAIEAIAPAPPQTEKPAFLEKSNATSTTLSGARLRLMLAEDAGARFSKQEINITLSAEAVAALGISDEDVVTVQILRESDAVFSFGVAVNEESVTALTGTSVSLPYTPSGDMPVLSLQNDKAETAAIGSYAPQSGLATFVVDAPGKYTILDEAVPAGSAPEDSETATPKAVPILPIGIATAALLLLGGGVFFLRRRWKK